MRGQTRSPSLDRGQQRPSSSYLSCRGPLGPRPFQTWHRGHQARGHPNTHNRGHRLPRPFQAWPEVTSSAWDRCHRDQAQLTRPGPRSPSSSTFRSSQHQTEFITVIMPRSLLRHKGPRSPPLPSSRSSPQGQTKVTFNLDRSHPQLGHHPPSQDRGYSQIKWPEAIFIRTEVNNEVILQYGPR